MSGVAGCAVSQNDALEEVGLLSTWKIEPADLNIRMKSGKPMLLGEGEQRSESSLPCAAFARAHPLKGSALDLQGGTEKCTAEC